MKTLAMVLMLVGCGLGQVRPNSTDHKECYERPAGDGCNTETVCGDSVTTTALYCKKDSNNLQIRTYTVPEGCDETQIKMLIDEREHYRKVAQDALNLSKEYEKKLADLRKSLDKIKADARLRR